MVFDLSIGVCVRACVCVFMVSVWGKKYSGLIFKII